MQPSVWVNNNNNNNNNNNRSVNNDTITDTTGTDLSVHFKGCVCYRYRDCMKVDILGTS